MYRKLVRKLRDGRLIWDMNKFRQLVLTTTWLPFRHVHASAKAGSMRVAVKKAYDLTLLFTWMDFEFFLGVLPTFLGDFVLFFICPVHSGFSGRLAIIVIISHWGVRGRVRFRLGERGVNNRKRKFDRSSV